ncbi:bacterial regulatory helix-turn-helix s, AraC family protein [Mycobacterium kansasii 662]|uniref:Bacterial regulatory helix-turn-helix s, AraC family protein n=1 Tax=Mycobacterium kansasii 662 TaxID=1299326 RepID=X7ZDL1_MYCKA|nr:bacterial regulatory helix-turn-helix s, AraC family protein [Mycobacterium kansasii 662]
MLDGRRGHHALGLRRPVGREFPAVEVDRDPIFIRSSETLWTPAGVTAGIDLALSLVEDDRGTEIAQTVARWLVLYLRRPRGQTQFAAPVWLPRAQRPTIRQVQEAIETQPGGCHRIDDLARRAAMSPRHFTRVFTDEVGEAPGPIRRTRSAPKPRAGNWKRPTTPWWPSPPVAGSAPQKRCAPQLYSPYRHPAATVPQILRLTLQGGPR